MILERDPQAFRQTSPTAAYEHILGWSALARLTGVLPLPGLPKDQLPANNGGAARPGDPCRVRRHLN